MKAHAAANSSFMITQSQPDQYLLEASIKLEGDAAAGDSSSATAEVSERDRDQSHFPGQFAFQVNSPVTLKYHVSRERNGVDNQHSNPFGRDDMALYRVPIGSDIEELGYWGVDWENSFHPKRTPNEGSLVLQPGSYAIAISVSGTNGTNNANPYSTVAHVSMSLNFSPATNAQGRSETPRP
jgi:hypothetical protein